MNEISYGFETLVQTTELVDTIVRVRAALKSEGFAILTEIDVQQTLKAKLNKDFRRYHILGACNPQLTYRALTAESRIGLLLPCNVVVQDFGDAAVLVSIADPGAMLSPAENPELESVVEEAFERLQQVIESLRT